MLARLAIGILLIVLVSLGFFKLLMSPPFNELGLMALFLGITAFVSALAGYAAYRFGWVQLVANPALDTAGRICACQHSDLLQRLVLGAVDVCQQHDLPLAIVLLVFASGIAMILGYFLSSTVTERIHLLKEAAEKLAAGRPGNARAGHRAG